MASTCQLEVFETNTHDLVLFIRKHYFNVRARDIILGGLMPLVQMYESQIYYCGIDFEIIDEDLPEEIYRDEIFFYKIRYPAKSTKYRFMPDFNPFKLDKIKSLADKFGSNTNLHAFYTDAISLWTEETGLPYPVDSSIPSQITDYWNGLNLQEDQRRLMAARADLQETWSDAKEKFQSTDDQDQRSSAVFNVAFCIQYRFDIGMVLPDDFPPIECQDGEDNKMIRGALERAGTLEEFIELVIIASEEKLESEREYRKIVNEVWIEAQFMIGNIEKIVFVLLKRFGLLKEDRQATIVEDQLEIIKRVVKAYESLEDKSRENLEGKIAKKGYLKKQEIKDIVDYLISNRPENIRIDSEKIPF